MSDFPLESLPDDLAYTVAKHLDPKDVLALILTSKALSNKFIPVLQRLHEACRNILLAMMNGQPALAVEIFHRLKKSSPQSASYALVFKLSGMEKHCGRSWDKVSVLEFCLWSGDIIHMLKILKESADNNAVLRNSVHQIKALKERKTQHGGIMAKFDELIQECQAGLQQANVEDALAQNLSAVSRAQSKLPVYGWQELCRPILWGPHLFSLVPAINFKKLPEVPRECNLSNGVSLLSITEWDEQRYVSHIAADEIFLLDVDLVKTTSDLYAQWWYFSNLRDKIMYEIAKLETELQARVLMNEANELFKQSGVRLN